MPDALELFRERVAIMTLDGKVSEDSAVRQAYSDLKKLGVDIPQEVKDAVREAVNRQLGI